jgi:GDP-L-fucose synthase
MAACMKKDAKIYVAGHKGMVGSAIIRRLKVNGFHNILYRDREYLDLLNSNDVHCFLKEERPDYMFIAAARVGGIHANNTFRAEFLYENIQIQTNLIHGAHTADIQKLLFLGSSCIYPRECPQPITEEALLTGPLETTNEPYAIAKIAGIKMADAYNSQYGREYISVMPTNLYGPNDNYDALNSHVLPALIRKAHEAKISYSSNIEVWGTGEPRREFLHVDDLAGACVFLMETNYAGPLLNVGTGKDIKIADLASLVMDVVGVDANISFNTAKPDGTMQKLLDVEKINALGWQASIELREGISDAYLKSPFCNAS